MSITVEDRQFHFIFQLARNKQDYKQKADNGHKSNQKRIKMAKIADNIEIPEFRPEFNEKTKIVKTAFRAELDNYISACKS